jgi:ABC-type multidrug transport system fused ATPase/permease subunit
LVVVIAGIGAALPVVVSRMVDLLKGEPSLTAISLVGLTILLIGFGLWGLTGRGAVRVRAVGDVVLDLRTRAFRAAAEHDLSFYDQFSSGRIVSRITSDTNDFGQLSSSLQTLLHNLSKPSSSAWSCSAPTCAWLMLMASLPIIFPSHPASRLFAVTKRGESHVRCQRRDQGNHQRYFHREKLSSGREYLPVIR